MIHRTLLDKASTQGEYQDKLGNTESTNVKFPLSQSQQLSYDSTALRQNNQKQYMNQ